MSDKATWMIISWDHIDHLDDAYGKLVDSLEGTQEEAEESAKSYVTAGWKRVGIVREIKL